MAVSLVRVATAITVACTVMKSPHAS
jgi:hypothetical protein